MAVKATKRWQLPVVEPEGSPPELQPAVVRTHFVLRSANTKTGPTASVYRTESSCPTSCTLFRSGCYASATTRGGTRLFDVARHGEPDDYAGFLMLASKMPRDGVLRLNVTGDFLRDGEPDHAYIDAANRFADARPDVTIIAYTHAWRRLDPALFRFSVAASADTPDEARIALAAGWPPVIVDPGIEHPDTLIGGRLGGRRVVRCPHETVGVTCHDCKLCARPQRAIVAFTAHGTGQRKARAALASARERTAAEEG